jgi:hypothetical protein
MSVFLPFSDDDISKYEAAERFVSWLEKRAIEEARGDLLTHSDVNPAGRFWLGRLGPKDFVTRQDERGDRLEPCAIGLKLRPRDTAPWRFTVQIRFAIWRREPSERADKKQLRWRWTKSAPIEVNAAVVVQNVVAEQFLASNEIQSALELVGAAHLIAELRARVVGHGNRRALEICLVNSSDEDPELVDGRFFECSIAVKGLDVEPFILEALPDSFKYDRKVDAFGINCGFVKSGGEIRTSDGPGRSRMRPKYWSTADELPDLRFSSLAANPDTTNALLTCFETWASKEWSSEKLEQRASSEDWSQSMRSEAAEAKVEFQQELSRIRHGCELLRSNRDLRHAFCLMNESMGFASNGRFDAWRPFQVAFLLANLNSLIDPDSESDVVDVVWFATGGGKTETYLGLLLTAAFLDRIRGKQSGITAWSRFPLRMLSLQQTQRFANALAGGELVRQRHNIAGDPFSLGFLVGGGATPNRIKKESERGNDDADHISEMQNPFRLLEVCPFCRKSSVITRFDRAAWRLVHVCESEECPIAGGPLPLFVVDDEIWRFLPTVVIGTLDKAANVARHSGMRGLVGAPWGKCTRQGHGFTYAKRGAFPNGCLVPDCKGGEPQALSMESSLYAPSFRLQDELHLLRDSLGAVDAHYELALDSLQFEMTGARPKILASSATLTGYDHQIDVLYRRSARVFPQPAPKDGAGFWTSDSNQLMRRYVALAPRRLTVEFVVDRLIITIQLAIRRLLSEPSAVCADLNIDIEYGSFLANIYGTNVVYGNTLQDIDAVIRSSQTQYAELDPSPNVAALTGRTDFEEVRETLARLERPEAEFKDRLHLIAASSMMSHGVDIDRLNVMIMLAFPLGVAEFIQATARVGRRWPGIIFVVPKMTRERDASVYRSFPEFVSHGDRFVEAIPITRKSRRVLERTIAGLELARMLLIHEPAGRQRLVTIRDLNAYVSTHPELLERDREAIQKSLGIEADDEFIITQLKNWFDGFARNLREPSSDAKFITDLSPTGFPMTSLRDVEEQAPVRGDSSR